MSYITVTELKAMPLPVTTAQWAKVTDAQIQVTLDAATTAVERWLDRPLLSADYIEHKWGNGRLDMVLENYPVTALTTVSSVDAWGSPLAYDVGGFLINSAAGIITFTQNSLPQPFLQGNLFYRKYLWTIAYTAGLSTIPGDVKFATAYQAIDMLDPLFRGGTNFAQVQLINNLNEKIVDLLEPYKRHRMG